tara:strand:+ start:4549 stop:5052 length:504 start_codon:yes stop_codon:yes gene_type:complete
MSNATASLVRRPALPAGHTLQGKAFKGSFGKSTVIAALTSAHGGDPRIRIYTLKGKGMKSVSSEQSVAECAAKIALHDASAQPEPAPTPTRKANKGASKKAVKSQGRGVKAAEESLDAAMGPMPEPAPSQGACPSPRKKDSWRTFSGRVMKAGHSMKAAGVAWRARK